VSIKNFTKVKGQPKVWDIVRLDDEMQERARCIPVGDGSKLGLIGTVLSKEEYRKRVGPDEPDWEEPRAAGNYPTKRTNETMEDYEARIQKWNKCRDMVELFTLRENVMHAKFFEEFNPVVSDGLRKLKPGSCMEITTMDCSQYMNGNYGEWDLDTVNDNEARMNEPWDGSGLIIPILHKFEKVAELAVVAGSPISMVNMVTKLLDVIKPVAAFWPAVREILVHDYQAWTWEAVKDHLEKFESVLEPGNGYQAMNKASKTNAAKATSDSCGGDPSRKARKTS
jgi:hypothetical protein